MSVETFSVESARHAAELNEWVAAFLASPGSDNDVLAAALTDPPRFWLGPVKVPIERLHRLAGPPGHPVLRPAEDEEWHDGVREMKRLIQQEGWEPTPVIATYREGELQLEDGNHRLEALRQAHVAEAWTLIGFETEAERDAFRC